MAGFTINNIVISLVVFFLRRVISFQFHIPGTLVFGQFVTITPGEINFTFFWQVINNRKICANRFGVVLTATRFDASPTIGQDRLPGWGQSTLYFAGQGIQQQWKMKRDMLSPRYTTRLSDLLQVR